MKPTFIILTFLFITSAVLAQGTTPPKSTTHDAAAEIQAQYTCPMHPEITSDKPGKCPKCGMTLVVREQKVIAPDVRQSSDTASAGVKIDQVKSLLREAKRELAREGKYVCCIKGTCDRCALDHQSCSCAEEVKAGKTVCSDCYAGWQRGDGIVKGVDAKNVKGGFHRHKH